MAMDGLKWKVGDIVLLSDLSASDRQPPFPQLGVIHDWMNPLQSQAIVYYDRSGGHVKTVNRPLSLLTRQFQWRNRSLKKACCGII